MEAEWFSTMISLFCYFLIFLSSSLYLRMRTFAVELFMPNLREALLMLNLLWKTY